MEINMNNNAFWICFWIIVAIVVISTSFVDKLDNSFKENKDRDPIAQRIEAINESGMFSEQKAKAIEAVLKSATNYNAEIILEKK